MVAWITAFEFQWTSYMIIWMTAIRELISGNQIPAKIEFSKDLLTQDVLLGELKNKPL